MNKVFQAAIAIISTFWLFACSSTGFAVINLPTYFNQPGPITNTYNPSTSQALDIYVPHAVTVETPVIIFFYGGRWQTGKKQDYRFIGSLLAGQGYIGVIPDYRKYPDVKFPAFVEDGAAAVAWVMKNYPGRKIYLSGHSAGAHIASLIVADEHYLKRHNINADHAIAGFIGLAGPYAFTPDDADLMDMFGPPENYPNMQATTFINGHEAPMLLLYGEDDTDVKDYNHKRLTQKITTENGRVKFITYPGVDHLGIIKGFTWLETDSPVRRDFFNFLTTKN